MTSFRRKRLGDIIVSKALVAQEQISEILGTIAIGRCIAQGLISLGEDRATQTLPAATEIDQHQQRVFVAEQ